MLIIDHASRNVLLLIAGLRPWPWIAGTKGEHHSHIPPQHWLRWGPKWRTIAMPHLNTYWGEENAMGWCMSFQLRLLIIIILCYYIFMDLNLISFLNFKRVNYLRWGGITTIYSSFDSLNPNSVLIYHIEWLHWAQVRILNFDDMRNKCRRRQCTSPWCVAEQLFNFESCLISTISR